MNSSDTLCGKSYLVTGGEGLIGSRICKEILDKGGYVISCDIKESLICEDQHPNYSYFEADITTTDGLHQLKERIYSNNLNIEGFILSAYPRTQDWGRSFENLDLDYLNLNLQLQLGSALILSKIFCEYLVSNGGGNLIHISSIQGLGAPKFEHYVGTKMTSPIEYTAVKAAKIAITKWLTKYYSNNNIRINCVSPGGVEDGQPPNFVEKYRSSCTNIGLLSPKEVADVVVFLLTDSSRGINGQNIVIDDGWSL